MYDDVTTLPIVTLPTEDHSAYVCTQQDGHDDDKIMVGPNHVVVARAGRPRHAAGRGGRCLSRGWARCRCCSRRARSRVRSWKCTCCWAGSPKSHQALRGVAKPTTRFSQIRREMVDGPVILRLATATTTVRGEHTTFLWGERARAWSRPPFGGCTSCSCGGERSCTAKNMFLHGGRHGIGTFLHLRRGGDL